jgi:hypothetical protein
MSRSHGLLAGYGSAAATTATVVAAGGTRHSLVALVVIALVMAGVASRLSVPLGAAAGAMSWLFYDGFIIGRHAELAWHGSVTGWQAAVCLGAGATGSLGAAWSRVRKRADGEKATPAGSQSRRYGDNVVYLAAARQRREARRTSA